MTKKKQLVIQSDKQPERWTTVRDDDGHEYLIPANRVDEFHDWDEKVTEEEGCGPTDVDMWDEYRKDGGRLTFTDPKIED